MITLVERPTRNLFFTGKGGVGKTTLACATAVQLADQGLRVLLISTDPASNLHDVLATEIASEPTPVGGVPNLRAMNIDPASAAKAYRERMVEAYRGVLPDAALASMEEQLSGSCTLEIASFDEFSRLLGDDRATAEYDHVIFDTAPTGHTLRLLALPAAWAGFMEANTTGTSCLGPLAGLQAQKELYLRSIDALSDPNRTTLVLVTRPELSALQEAARTSGELHQLGVREQRLLVNGVFSAQASDDEFAIAMDSRCRNALKAIPEDITSLPQTRVPLLSSGLMGVPSVRQIGGGAPVVEDAGSNEEPVREVSVGLNGLVEEIAAPGHGVVMTMGKGGVGKTTVAASIAVALADRGHEVLLSTTDPAAHLEMTMGADTLPNLTVSRIDPCHETRKYRTEVMAAQGAELDEPGRALLEEDLRSPCTEEIAVFRAFARTVAAGSDRFVVIDTAPTGHTILLLDSALAYHREVTRQTGHIPEYVEQLLPRMRDPNYARVLIVTLPEATPVHEAAQLQQDLRRAEVEPFAWVVNQSFQSLAVADPALKQRRQNEVPFIREVRNLLSRRVAIIPWQKEPPAGVVSLRECAADGAVTKR